MDANPDAFLAHVGTAASVGAILDDEVARLTAAAPVPLLRSVFRLRFASELGLTGPLRHFVARLDGEIVASASTFAGAGTVGLYNVATVPQARGRGIGTAITLGALQAARREGHRTAMLGADAGAARLYRRLGFTDRAVMHIHRG